MAVGSKPRAGKPAALVSTKVSIALSNPIAHDLFLASFFAEYVSAACFSKSRAGSMYDCRTDDRRSCGTLRLAFVLLSRGSLYLAESCRSQETDTDDTVRMAAVHVHHLGLFPRLSR